MSMRPLNLTLRDDNKISINGNHIVAIQPMHIPQKGYEQVNASQAQIVKRNSNDVYTHINTTDGSTFTVTENYMHVLMMWESAMNLILEDA
jgi:hypothetical protein